VKQNLREFTWFLRTSGGCVKLNFIKRPMHNQEMYTMDATEVTGNWSRRRVLAAGLGAAAPPLVARAATASAQLLNVSYDVARELFAQINPAFASAWKASTGQSVHIAQSHGGSSAQARAVVEGLQADVVTLNQITDILFLQNSGMVAADWRQRLPYQASPSYSLPVFLVRAGNPRRIRDWDDLARVGVRVVLANPKTSGNGRYAYLGVYTDALEKYRGDERKAEDILVRVLGNVAVMDTGGRGATTTFVEREVGDVLVTFESEVNSILRERPAAGLQVVVPPMSVHADFPVAVVDKVVDRHGTRELATAYTQFLFTDPAQDILARNFNRVRSAAIAQRYQQQFPPVRLVALEQRLGDWPAIARKHFEEGGVLDLSLARLPH
jgi:sulfate/thiosulfate transport system substrate-binding protein